MDYLKRCGTAGDDVEITWYKDSEPVRVGNAHRVLLPNGSLLLLKVNSGKISLIKKNKKKILKGGTDPDSGVYHCIARNRFGEVRSQDANVRVAVLRDEFRINPHAVQV